MSFDLGIKDPQQERDKLSDRELTFIYRGYLVEEGIIETRHYSWSLHEPQYRSRPLDRAAMSTAEIHALGKMDRFISGDNF